MRPRRQGTLTYIVTTKYCYSSTMVLKVLTVGRDQLTVMIDPAFNYGIAWPNQRI